LETELLDAATNGFPIWIFVIIMVGTFIVTLFERKDISVLDFRKNQVRDFVEKDTIKQRITDYTSKKIAFSKRSDIETLCMQAGYSWSYTDYVIRCSMFAIILALVVGIVFNNPFMGLLFFFIGYILPKQVLGHKKNKRLKDLNLQIGPFMYMAIKRYETTHDFAKAIDSTAIEFKGVQPLYSELQKTVADIAVKVPVSEALDNLAKRSGNRFIARLSDFYKIAAHLGTEEIRKNLLMQAYNQYEEDRQLKELLKKEISTPVNDAYILIGTVPAMMLFGAFIMPGYVDFMLHTTMGKIGMTGITLVVLLAIWFVNTKIASPID